MNAVSLGLKMFFLLAAIVAGASVTLADGGNGKIESDREARLRMVRERSYCGVWSARSEFNRVSVHLDPGGKGLMFGGMVVLMFNWIADGNGVIACTIDPELIEFLTDDSGQPPDSLTFSLRYLPDTNALEMVSVGLFAGRTESESLQFISGKPEALDMIKRFREERDRRDACQKAKFEDYVKDKVVETVTNRCENFDALLESLTAGENFTDRMIVVATEVEGLHDRFLFLRQRGDFRVELELGRTGVDSRPLGFEGYVFPVRKYRNHPWSFPPPTLVCRAGIEELKKRWRKYDERRCEFSVVTKGENCKSCRDMVAFDWTEKQKKEAQNALSARFAHRFPCDVVVSTIRPR